MLPMPAFIPMLPVKIPRHGISTACLPVIARCLDFFAEIGLVEAVFGFVLRLFVEEIK